MIDIEKAKLGNDEQTTNIKIMKVFDMFIIWGVIGTEEDIVVVVNLIEM